MSVENPVFWGREGDDEVHCEGIGELLDEMAAEWCENEPFPEEVEVVGFDRDVISEKEKGWAAELALDYLLERWDDDFAGLNSTEHSSSMKAAAKEFVEKIAAEYQVWRCKEVVRMKVRVRDFLDEDEIPKGSE